MNNSDFYFKQDMRNQGFLFEHISSICPKIDIDWFIEAFMNSWVRKELDDYHPKFLNEAAKDLFEHFVEFDLDNDFSKIKKTDKEQYFKHYQLYWIGWMYAYLVYRTNSCSNLIYEILNLDEMLRLYNLGHEMSKEIFYDKVEDRLKNL